MHLVKTIFFCITALSFCPILSFVSSTSHIVIFSEYGHNENLKKTLDQDAREPMRPVGLGAASNLLLTALYQEMPVLVPAGLWQSIVDHKKFFDECTTTELDKLYEKYGSYTRFRNKSDLVSFANSLRHVNITYKDVQVALQESTTPDSFEKKLRHILKKTSNQMEHFTWLEITRFVLCASIPLNRYQIKEIPGKIPFYLFLPKKFLTASHQIKSCSSFSSSEKKLGLKIDRFNTIQKPYDTLFDGQTIPSNTDILQEALEKIFIKKGEVQDCELQRWALFIMGHGTFSQGAQKALKKIKKHMKSLEQKKRELTLSNGQGQTVLKSLETQYRRSMQKAYQLEQANKVIGLPIEAFQRLIHFFDQSIETGLLFYSSCSAGGKHSIDAFDKDGQPILLPFPVIIDTLSEAPAFTFPSELKFDSSFINWADRSIILDAPYDFVRFFQSTKHTNPNESCLNDCVKSMATFLKKAPVGTISIQPNDVNNILSIRLPYKTHFCAMDSANLFCTTPANTSLKIPAHKEVVFLTEPTIAKIDLSAKKSCPFFFSLIPGKASHRIQELYAPQQTLHELIDHFFPVEELNASKLIHVHKLHCKDEQKSSIVLENVYFFNKAPHPHKPKSVPCNGVLFVGNEHGYIQTWPFIAPPPCPINLEEHDAAPIKKLIGYVEKFFKNANDLQRVIPQDKYVLSSKEICKELCR